MHLDHGMNLAFLNAALFQMFRRKSKGLYHLICGMPGFRSKLLKILFITFSNDSFASYHRCPKIGAFLFCENNKFHWPERRYLILIQDVQYL